MKRSVSLLALCLALSPASALAQVRISVSAAAEGSSAAGAAARTGSAVVPFSPPSLSLPSGSLSLSPSPVPSINAVSFAQPLVQSVVPAAVTAQPVVLTAVSRKVAPSVSVVKSISPLSSPAVAAPLSRSQKAVALVDEEVADWGALRQAEEFVPAALGRSLSNLSPMSAASVPEAREAVPAPRTPALGRPRLSRALLVSGTVLVGAALAVAAAPALVPAALTAWKGGLVWAGFSALAASRFWKAPGSAPDIPRGPPARAGGSLASFKIAWAAARDSAAAQRSFETRVGGSSLSSFRDWLLGGMRTGLYWMAPALLLMLGGAIAAKAAIAGFAAFGLTATVGAAGGAAASFAGMSLFFGYLPLALAAEAASVALFFGVTALARKLGAGRAAPWLGGALALGAAGAVLMTLTPAPFVIAVSLALEAGVLWSALRSNSFLAPLALRGILTLFSIEAARLSLWLNFGAAGVLVGLPPVWGGLAVAGLVLLAVKLKSPGLRLSELGAWWKAETPGQRPKSPWRLVAAGLVWGLVVYALGDLTFWGVNALAPGSEPAPAILAKMLTAGVDLVLYNFVIVGVLEEYIFRRGLFKMMNEKLDKWGLSLGKAFWLAAVGSALIFSGVHYIDWGAVMAWFGMGDATASAGLGGAYAFTWAGFVARSVLGVLLAWIYKRSGVILVPMIAHFWADTMEGLGLAWGLPVFLALAAGALVLSLFSRLKPKSS